MKKIFLLLIGLTFFVIFFEFISYLTLDENSRKIPRSQLPKLTYNEYLNDLSLNSGCGFAETLVNHSTLGFIHRQKEFLPNHCKESYAINNIGVISQRDLPLKKDSRTFSILVIGSSVAQNLSEYYEKKGELYFENILNKNYVSPNNMPFKVYTGAVAAWPISSQINFLMMYGPRVDAVVFLNGFIEANSIQNLKNIESMSTVTSILANTSSKDLKKYFIHSLTKFHASYTHYPLLQNSYFVNMIYNSLARYYRDFILTDMDIQELAEGGQEIINTTFEEKQFLLLENYIKYLKLIPEICRSFKLKNTIFLQPVPSIGKKLSTNELKINIKLDKKIYTKLDLAFAKLSSQSNDFYSLTHIFENENGDIYGDDIHLKVNEIDLISKGNEILAQKMAEKISLAWKLKHK